MSKRQEGIRYAHQKGYHITPDGIAISPRGIILKLQAMPNNGRLYFSLTTSNGRHNYNVLVHQLQAYQKFGEALFQSGIVVRHLNNNRLDNSWDNIAMGTQSQNILDIPLHIRIAKARHAVKHLRRFTPEQIKQIRQDGQIMTLTQVAIKWKTYRSNVVLIINRQTYQDVD